MSPKQEINDLLNIGNVIKVGTLLVCLTGLYYKIDSRITTLYTEKHFENEHLQYQITELKDCCNGRETNKRVAFKQSPAILPHEIEMRDE